MRKLLRVTAFVFCAWTFTTVASFAAQAQTSSAKAEVPVAVAEVGELGENIYDLAKEKKWAEIVEKMTAITKEAEALKSQVKGATESKEQLGKSLTALDKAVAAKDQQVTLQEANRITLIATNLAEPFHPEIPVEITRLDYYGRELEIWSAANNDTKLKEAADALQKMWEKVRPSVKEHGGAKAAKTFDGLVTKLKAAKTAKQYSKVATPILDEVDNLEKVFAK